MASRKAEIAAKSAGKKRGGGKTSKPTRKGKAASKEHAEMMEGEGQQAAAHTDEPMTDVEGK